MPTFFFGGFSITVAVDPFVYAELAIYALLTLALLGRWITSGMCHAYFFLAISTLYVVAANAALLAIVSQATMITVTISIYMVCFVCGMVLTGLLRLWLISIKDAPEILNSHSRHVALTISRILLGCYVLAFALSIMASVLVYTTASSSSLIILGGVILFVFNLILFGTTNSVLYQTKKSVVGVQEKYSQILKASILSALLLAPALIVTFTITEIAPTVVADVLLWIFLIYAIYGTDSLKDWGVPPSLFPVTSSSAGALNPSIGAQAPPENMASAPFQTPGSSVHHSIQPQAMHAHPQTTAVQPMPAYPQASSAQAMHLASQAINNPSQTAFNASPVMTAQVTDQNAGAPTSQEDDPLFQEWLEKEGIVPVTVEAHEPGEYSSSLAQPVHPAQIAPSSNPMHQAYLAQQGMPMPSPEIQNAQASVAQPVPSAPNVNPNSTGVTPHTSTHAGPPNDAS
ncbi:hypothetical protein BJ684DRAFT_15393 [Piptocephalis cylindrospora]|uniref:Uncharacterized protein n=1 Tax=Piptocephalis cylindrospora TaxID=1907219 RepID=A0A4P9Y5L2_9FUNG|nr:hypothetical protein BJ684DRAFT_15393 [Piptocephalis cylindrospora]|eukprot:RKP14267.1 hypothetical protein BJ684DRAFT_15393 [Piptocephalis cylindrospora]